MTSLTPMHSGPTARKAYLKRLVSLGLVVTFGFALVCGYILWEIRLRDRDAARQTAANLVQTISSEVERNLEIYDLSLQAVAESINLPEVAKMSPGLRQITLFDRAATAKGLGSIFVLDRNGNVTLDSRTLTPPSENHGHSDYFTVYANGRVAGPYLSKPWRGSDGELLIGLSRRLSAPDGSFAGVVVGTLRLSYLRDMFNKLSLGEKHALTLVRDDGILIIRDPFDKNMIGRDLGATRIFKRIAASRSGWFEDVARIDGVDRMYVFQHVGTLPLMLSYGQSSEAIYAPWWHQAWRIGILALTLCVVNLALVIFLARTLKLHADAEQKMALMAMTDGLTGLRNRRYLDQMFDVEWRRAMRTSNSIALLMIDADNFKKFNDQFGHQAGDEALIAIARCIASKARRSCDTCGRYGGEEFIVLLPGTSLKGAMTLAEEIRASLESSRATHNGAAISYPTVSIGACAMVPHDGSHICDLLKAADRALYRAKKKGRNRVESAPEVRLAKAKKAIAA